MNKFVNAIKALDVEAVSEIVANEPKWLKWEAKDGKNGIHFVCGVPMIEMKPNGKAVGNRKDKEARSLAILKLLLKAGVDMNSLHRIPDKDCGHFPATPVWWAYTRGRNETIYKYLLRLGADPRGCMYAITWYDDVKAAALFKKYGSFARAPSGLHFFEQIDGPDRMDSPLLAAFAWKKWKMAEWLLKNGADPDPVDNKGCSALFHAVRKKYDQAHIKLLLKYGADPDRKCTNGVTPRVLAEKYRDKTIRELFR